MNKTFEDYMQQDNLRMYAAIARIRKLHSVEDFDDAGVIEEICSECREFYPCETIQALEPSKDDLTEFPKFEGQ